jgi:hypothetical protein
MGQNWVASDLYEYASGAVEEAARLRALQRKDCPRKFWHFHLMLKEAGSSLSLRNVLYYGRPNSLVVLGGSKSGKSDSGIILDTAEGAWWGALRGTGQAPGPEAKENPDVDLRELERRAAGGDPRAETDLERALLRAGLPFKYPLARLELLHADGQWSPGRYPDLFWALIDTEADTRLVDIALDKENSGGLVDLFPELELDGGAYAEPWERNRNSYVLLRAYRMGKRGRVEVFRAGEVDRFYLVESPFGERGGPRSSRKPHDPHAIDAEIGLFLAVRIPGTEVDGVPSILAGTGRGFTRYGQTLRSQPSMVVYPDRYSSVRIMQAIPRSDHPRSGWGKYRWKNPDEPIRRLERLAAQGDPEAAERLERWQERTAEPAFWHVVTCGPGTGEFASSGPGGWNDYAVWATSARTARERARDLGERPTLLIKPYRIDEYQLRFYEPHRIVRNNPDVDLRELERRWRSTEDPDDLARLVAARIRTGVIPEHAPRFAVLLAHGSPVMPPPPPRDPGWFVRPPEAETRWTRLAKEVGERLGYPSIPRRQDGYYPSSQARRPWWLETTAGGRITQPVFLEGQRNVVAYEDWARDYLVGMDRRALRALVLLQVIDPYEYQFLIMLTCPWGLAWGHTRAWVEDHQEEALPAALESEDRFLQYLLGEIDASELASVPCPGVGE